MAGHREGMRREYDDMSHTRHETSERTFRVTSPTVSDQVVNRLFDNAMAGNPHPDDIMDKVKKFIAIDDIRGMTLQGDRHKLQEPFSGLAAVIKLSSDGVNPHPDEATTFFDSIIKNIKDLAKNNERARYVLKELELPNMENIYNKLIRDPTMTVERHKQFRSALEGYTTIDYNERVKFANEVLDAVRRHTDIDLKEFLPEAAILVNHANMKESKIKYVHEIRESILRAIEPMTEKRLLRDYLPDDLFHILASSGQDDPQEVQEADLSNDRSDEGKKGSWDSLLGNNWLLCQKFWESGTKPWSKGGIVEKRITSENKTEFQEMQDKRIPGTYMENLATGDRTYLPIYATGVWSKFAKKYAYSPDQRAKIIRVTANGFVSENWKRTNSFDRPDVEVKTPTETHNHSISPGGSQDYFDTNFSGREDIGHVTQLRSIIRGDKKKAKGVERTTPLPQDDWVTFGSPNPSEVRKKDIIDTPIFWEGPQNQQ